ncbi:MAG: hypothetical protein EXR68_05810 [Dehalococcoidia bacterium]|nr:hypothetical protein [Dehalococcoidia bacterium]
MPRPRLLVALAVDVGTLVAALCASGLVATVWLLVRTGAGRLDPSEGDAVIALALWAAVAPAWTAWQWRALRAHGASVGVRRAGAAGALRLQGRRRLVWLLVHPVAVPAWAWLTLTAGIPGALALAIGPLVVTAGVLSLALASCALALVRPGAVPLHTRLARAGRRNA